jgi:hypothetical protein
MDRDTLTLNMHRAGNQWAVCCAMGDYDEAARIAEEIEGYSRALDRIDNPWDELKGSPDHSRVGNG